MMRIVILCLALMLAVVSQVGAEDWHTSKWGKDDTIGAANLVTPERILAATKLVKTGKRYALGQVTSRDTPAFGTRSFELFAVSNGSVFDGTGEPYADNHMTTNDDWALVWMGVGSQIDGLGHVGIDHVYYNGNHVRDFFSSGGLKKLGTQDIPPIVGRGVLLDIVGYLKEKDPSKVMTVGGLEMLKEGTAINQPEIEGALMRQALSLQAGDIVLLHTGYMEMADIDTPRYKKSIPGLGVQGAQFLGSHDPVAIGADTFALEVIPFENQGNAFEVHLELIPKRGIYILENMVTRELVNDQAWEFMFVLGQARMQGAVQMIINPVAIR
ncbi:MAG: cyclase family protein [Proteobacteria bacterium]|nr:cyclase family protein [Pseudomonadota bacterium]